MRNKILVLAALMVLVNSAAADVVINEIIQNPSAVADSSGEWFELHNTAASPVDIDGWTVQDNDFDIFVINNGGPLNIAAGGYLVLGNNSDSNTNGGVAVDYQYSGMFLGNSGDELVLLDTGLTEVDRVEWDNGATFPDPNGASMSLDDPTSDNNVGANWCTATTPFGAGDLGTPGAANDCAGSSISDIVINEIMQNPSAVFDSAGEWFEIHNTAASPVDIDGWTVQDNDFDSFVINNGGPLTIAPGGYLVLGNNSDSGTNGGVAVDYQYSGMFLSNGADELVLLDTGLTEVDRVEWDGGTAFPDPNGASMSLDDPTSDNNVGANWCTGSTVFGAGDLGTPGAANDCGTGPPLGACFDPATFIHDVQGSGPSSPLNGVPHVKIEGVVVGQFQGAGQLGGFFLQEEDAQADADPTTSEGIFVATNKPVAAGDVVRVQGTVDEFFGLTRLENVTKLAVCSVGGSVSPTDITLPVSAVTDFEYTEGMLVRFPGTLYASGNFNQGRFGEVDLSVGAPLDNPTNVVAPGGPAQALSDLNNRSRIQLDDGSNVQNPLPLPPYIGAGGTLRTGDTVEDLTAVMSFSFGAYELHPVAPVNFTRVNARVGLPSVGGAVRVASFNVLNYFTTLDNLGDICGPASDQGCRGADNATEFMRQRDKLVTAITALDAHVVGVIEIENASTDVPIGDLVDGLNDATVPGTYAYVSTGPIGTDAIRVGLIYQPTSVTPAGPFAVLDSSVDPTFNDDKNRPVLAQSFSENTNGVVFTVAVNHLKSKGSNCNDVGDPDIGDGQGNCNGVRTAAAAALVDWLATDPTGSGSDDFLIIGDLNAYSQEDPVTTIETAGYSDLIETWVGTGFADGAYSFNFFSESGSLDHALSSPSMEASVTGAAIWHINADEPRALDYNDFNQPALYNPDEFRSSDHDPVLVGLFGDEDNDGVFDVLDNCPATTIPESVPTSGQLNPNHWALVDDDFEFDTVTKGKGKGPNRSYSTADTAGCSCEQIIEAQGLGNGLSKYGCTIDVMDAWVELVAP